MRRVLLALLLVAGEVAATGQGAVTLAGMRDRARPLLVFAPKPDDTQLSTQLRSLRAGATELAARDVVVIALPWNSHTPTTSMLSARDALAARRRFHIAPNAFAVILIGKDGGEKLRSETPLTVEKLRATIDAMPMRQEEMRSKPPY
jgi:hypothetical protein